MLQSSTEYLLGILAGGFVNVSTTQKWIKKFNSREEILEKEPRKKTSFSHKKIDPMNALVRQKPRGVKWLCHETGYMNEKIKKKHSRLVNRYGSVITP